MEEWVKKHAPEMLYKGEPYKFKCVEELTPDNFKGKVIESKLPVVMDFSAEWCKWCQKIAPDFDALCEEYKDRAFFGTYDVDKGHEIPERYGVDGLPTFGFFDKGEAKKKFWVAGALKKSELKEQIDAFLKSTKFK